MKRLKSRIHRRWHRHVPVRTQRRLATALRAGSYVATALVAVFLLLLIAGHVLLPRVAARKIDVESYLSAASGQHIVFDKLDAYWDGVHPGLRAEGVTVRSSAGARVAIRLEEVRLSVSLLPLVWGEAQINRLVVRHARLALIRLKDGHFRVSGLDTIGPEQGDGAILNWLLRQRRMAIEDGEVVWNDERDPAGPVHLTHVNLTLRNDGERHRVGVQARFPASMCRECAVHADIRGNPFGAEPWRGEFWLHAADLNLEGLPRIALELLPAHLRGHVTADLDADWRDNAVQALRGPLAVTGLSVPLPRLTTPVEIGELRGTLDWAARDDGWRFDMADAMVALRGKAWPAGPLHVDFRPERSVVEIGHVDLADVTSFAGSLGLAAPEREQVKSWRDPWLALAPRGALEQTRLELRGPFSAPQNFTLETQLDKLATEPYRDVPGVQGLSGRLQLSRDGGEFALASANLKLNYSQLFREPFTFWEAGAKLTWKRGDGGWQIDGEDLALTSEDLQADGTLGLTLPQEGAPTIKLHVDFQGVNGNHARRYFPAKILSPKLVTWMDRSFLGGRITDAQLDFDGRTSDFPFRNRNGRFEVRAHVNDAVYQYLEGWAPLRGGDVNVSVINNDVIVTGDGHVGGTAASQIVVRTEVEHTAPVGTVRVSARFNGPFSETLAVLRAVKLPPGDTSTWQGYIPSALKVSGNGTLNLGVVVPLNENPAQVTGEYRVTDAGLAFPALGIQADGVAGAVEFNEDGVRGGKLRGRLLGGDATLVIDTSPGGVTEYHGSGRATAAGLAPSLGPLVAAHVSGDAGWQANWTEKGLLAEIDLRTLRSDLPPPLNRPNGLLPVPLTLRSEPTRRRRGAANPPGLEIAIGPTAGVSGRIALVRQPSGWRFARGHVAFGESSPIALPDESGFSMSARIDRLDMDAWLKYLPDAGDTAATDGGPTWISRIGANIRALDMFDRPLGHMVVDLRHDPGGWSGGVNGETVAGQVSVRTDVPRGLVRLNLARLILPPVKAGSPTRSEADPRHLPAIRMTAENFALAGHTLGRLEVNAAPVENGLHLTRLDITRPEGSLTATGNWLLVGKQVTSQYDARLTSDDIGATLAAAGFPDQMQGGEVDIKAKLTWPGAVPAAALGNVNGRIDVQAKKGRFLQVKPGAERLFGLLDLSSIGRYLTLDFSPIFGKGMIYDDIHGTVTLENGNAYTRDLEIHPAAAQVDVSGRVGLAAQDYDLTIDVEPKLSNTLTIASWGFFGPQVAAVVLAVQKLFKEQIARGTRVTYVVKGPWKNPAVTKKQTGPSPAKSPTDLFPVPN